MRKCILSHVLASCLALAAAPAVYAQTTNTTESSSSIALKADYPDSYTVSQGDTLWGISERFLEDPWKWKDIWQNNDQISNPHLIYPGDVIRLVIVDGQPRLTVDRVTDTNKSLTTPPSQSNISQTATNNSSSVESPLKTIKLSPKIRVLPIGRAIESIPLESINNFLSRNRIVDIETLAEAPHIVAGAGGRLILSAGDTVYARGEMKRGSNSYGIYRQGVTYIDPETNESLGVQALDIGSVSIRAREKDVTRFTITRSSSEIRIGDYLLPNQKKEITSTFLPTPPENEVTGQVISLEGAVGQAAKLDVISVNLGRKDGVNSGNVLAIHKKGDIISDRNAKEGEKKTLELPNERSGLLLIFQSFEKMSLGIVLDANTGIYAGDYVGNP